MVSRRSCDSRRPYRTHRPLDHGPRRTRDRCCRLSRCAGFHRSAYTRDPRNFSGADCRQLRAAGRHDHHGRPGRRLAGSAEAVSRQACRVAQVTQHRKLPGPGFGAPGSYRARQPSRHCGGNRAHARNRAPGHARRRVWIEHRALLHPGQFHAAGGGGRTAEGRRALSRRAHVAHARRSVARARQR